MYLKFVQFIRVINNNSILIYKKNTFKLPYLFTQSHYYYLVTQSYYLLTIIMYLLCIIYYCNNNIL